MYSIQDNLLNEGFVFANTKGSCKTELTTDKKRIRKTYSTKTDFDFKKCTGIQVIITWLSQIFVNDKKEIYETNEMNWLDYVNRALQNPNFNPKNFGKFVLFLEKFLEIYLHFKKYIYSFSK